MRVVYWLCGIVAAACVAVTILSALYLVLQVVVALAVFIAVCWSIIYVARAVNKLKKKPPS